MSDSFLGRVTNVIRRGYRAVVPVAIRRRLRGKLARPTPRPSRSPRPPSPKPTQSPKITPSPPTPQPPPRPPRYGRPALRRFELPLPVGSVEGRSQGHRRESLVIEVSPRYYVTKTIHAGGLVAYEPETQALLLGLAEVLTPQIVFDVGANVGPHALLLPALLDVPVIAFEPAAEVAATLRRLAETNDLQCTVVETAVGDRDGTATLYISPTDTSTSLQAGFRQATREVTVPLVSLDSYVRSTGLRPTLLKIDTETTEPDVLRGAVELLETRPWIVCEILPGRTEAAVEDLLRPFGYRMFQVVDNVPLPERDTIPGFASLDDNARNWLFAPEAPDESLWEAVSRWRRAIEEADPPRDLPAEDAAVPAVGA